MSYTPTPFEALQQAIEVFGSQTAAAAACGVSQAAVWKWLQSSKRLPAEHVLDVEAKTGISRHILRPDIYPRGLKDDQPYPGLQGRIVAVDELARPCERSAILQRGRAA